MCVFFQLNQAGKNAKRHSSYSYRVRLQLYTCSELSITALMIIVEIEIVVHYYKFLVYCLSLGPSV